MNETNLLNLPLLQPSQAQKHVTVNEALVLLDGLAQISVMSRILPGPPVSFSDGDCYALPAGCSGVWAGQDGKLALASNGGWVFVQPREGWSAWFVDENARATFVHGAWQVGVMSTTGNGASSLFASAEAELVLQAGGAQLAGLELPATSLVFACSARVVEAMGGGVASWSLDTSDGEITFGTGMGVQAGSYCTGLLSQPAAIFSAKSVRVTPVGGDFVDGRLSLALHYYHIALPN